MIGAVITLVKEGFGYFRETRKAEHELRIANVRNRQRLAESAQSHNQNWEMASLESNDRLLRIVSFCLFALPLIITVVRPDMGQQIFSNLDTAPEWYVQTFIAINGGVWGIVELKHAAPAFIHGIKTAFRKHHARDTE